MHRLIVSSVAVALLSAVAAGQAVAADLEAGRKAFNKCAACHAIEPGKNKVGPSLSAIVGRKAGTQEGYSYSAAMKGSGLTWDVATLDKYIEKPNELVKGSKMAFAGIKDATERANLVAYLETLK